MKVFLSGRFSRRHELHAIGKELQARGHIIVSRWTLPGLDHAVPVGMSEQAADSERLRFAFEDIQDIIASDWIISLMEEPRGNGRGGRHIEFGFAYAMHYFDTDRMKLTIIGPRETVFHHLSTIEHFDSVEDLLNAQSQRTPQ